MIYNSKWGLNKICLIEDVTSVISSETENRKYCTDKCLNAVCGHYSCLSMYDNIKENDKSISVVFLHNLKALIDGYKGNNNKDKIKDENKDGNNKVLFRYKNLSQIYKRDINYPNLNRIINYNKSNHIIYDNDIVVEYNENYTPSPLNKSISNSYNDDENKNINIGILMDEDYIYKQMNISNNYEIYVDNYTYKFVQSGESGTQQQLNDYNQVTDDIFKSDICSEIKKVEVWVDLCYSLEATILVIFTLVVIKIVHYKKMTVNDTPFDDISEISSGSYYTLPEKNESLPSVVGPNISVNIFFSFFYLIKKKNKKNNNNLYKQK